MSLSFGRGSKSLADAEKTIDDSESALQRAMDARTINTRRNETSVSAVASEIRSLVKNLPPVDLMAWVSKQILDGDTEAVSAILNSYPAVSGFDRKDFALLRDEAERRFSPADYGERAALRAMRERLGAAGNHYLNRLNEIIPKPNLREAEGARALQKLRTGV